MCSVFVCHNQKKIGFFMKIIAYFPAFFLLSLSSIQVHSIPLKPMPENQPQPSAIVDESKFLNQAYEETFNVISFVRRNELLAQLCSQTQDDAIFKQSYQGWLQEQQGGIDATASVKAAYEQRLKVEYGDDFQQTFEKRQRLVLKGVQTSIDRIEQRSPEQVTKACHNWLSSVQDKQSFFYNKLGIGLLFFAENESRLLTMIDNDANW
jgi:hypothetical protein